MELYLDSAELSEVQDAVRLGSITSVYIDPTRLSHHQSLGYREMVQEVCYLAQVPIHVPTAATETEDIANEAIQTAQWSPYAVASIPISLKGLSAIHSIRDYDPDPDEMCVDCARSAECPLGREAAESLLVYQGVRASATLVCSIGQGVLAARSGADFIAVPVSRLAEAGDDGMETLAGVVGLAENYDVDTQVIAANIQLPSQVERAMKVGAHAAAVPYPVLLQCLQHPLTDELLGQWRAR